MIKIVNANTLEAKDVLLDLTSKVKSSHTEETVKMWLTFNLGTDMFSAWIAYDKDEPVGLITGEVVNAEGPTVFIAFNYVKSGTAINGQLIHKVEDWAKKLEIKKLLYYTKKSPATFIKKHGFELVQSVLKKEL